MGMSPSERVVQRITDDIRSGRLSLGQKLPSQRELAASYGVAIATMQKALRVLQDTGWVVTRQTIGTFVAANTPAERDEPVTLERLAQEVAALREQVAEEVGTLRERVERMEAD